MRANKDFFLTSVYSFSGRAHTSDCVPYQTGHDLDEGVQDDPQQEVQLVFEHYKAKD